MAVTVTHWPTVVQLEAMGFQRCKSQPCSTWVDPANVPSGFCLSHWRKLAKAKRSNRTAERTRHGE